MAICPIANSVGCENCKIVSFCLLKTVLGNYGDNQAGEKTENSESSESKPPD